VGGPLAGPPFFFAGRVAGAYEDDTMKRFTILAGVLLATALSGTGGCARWRQKAAPPALITIDSHVDIPVAYMREPRFDAGGDSVLQVDLGKMARGGLDAAFFVVYVEQGALDAAGYATAVAAADTKFEAIHRLVERHPARIRLATTPADVRRNHAEGRLSALIGIENGYSLGHDLARLDAAYARGARYLGLVHVGNNDLCGSSAPDARRGDVPNLGLTPFGASAVARANALGIMVDVSHASDACIADVLRASRAPVIASHSSARALVPHARNLTDDQLRGIAATGGVAQAVAYKEFVKADPGRAAAEEALQKQVAAAAGDAEWESERHEYRADYLLGMADIQRRFPLATLDEYLDHVQHMVRVAGIAHVGIASDFDGGGGLTGWKDATETRNVAAGLRARGFGDAEIAALWGGNLLRVLGAVEAHAARARDGVPAMGAVAAASIRATATAAAPGGTPFDRIVDAVVARYRLPGIAVGVIEDGVVTQRITRGELVAGSGRPVTPASLFKIASNTKAMTATLLARLVQAGKLRWDDPVVKHLPAFRLRDPWVTEHMLVRDLLVHNSGLPEGGGDLMLWPEPNEFTRDDIVAGLGHLRQAYGFRAGYAYDNTLYIVAGQVAAAAGGADYESLLRREVFAPLGLAHCRVGAFRLDAAGEVAQPHRRDGDGNVPINTDPPRVPAISSAAAGGVRCSLDDMLAWARNWLAPTPAQLAWLSPAQRAELWAARTPMPISARRRAWDRTHSLAYAFGFRLADMDGEWTVSHTGTLSGMYSAMLLLPDRRSGFVLMTNGNGDDARTVLTEALLAELVTPGAGRPVAALADELDKDAASPARSRAPDTSARRPATAEALRPWLGVWRDPWLGPVSVCAQDGAVRWVAAKSPRLRGQVMALGDDWLVQWDDDGLDAAWLRFAGAGASARLRMAKVDPDADFSSDYEDLAFERVGDCDAVLPARTAAEAGLVEVPATPGIALDMRYAGSDNFVGTPIDGYEAPRCLLRPLAAEALARVADALRARGLRLHVFDCYRPARAVAHFVRWAATPERAATRAAWHPNLPKSALMPDYIAPVSGHTRGATIDLGVDRCDGGACRPLDMGTAFDVFDPRANTDAPGLGAEQRANRDLLRAAMAAEGFENYPMEWWHYTWQPAGNARIRYDVPIR
jgi:microsomal dipeptidase-like Zn-dependent dipeptidase/D-alanyl-D-alanine dipeptidase/CubicO group peptidase (beta-lactamase class C family)